MKNIRILLSENFQFLVVKFSVYLNRHVFVMQPCKTVRMNMLIWAFVVHFCDKNPISHTSALLKGMDAPDSCFASF